MKRLYTLLIALMVSAGALWANYQAYCTAQYNAVTRVLIVNMGSQIFTPCDSKGNPLQFVSKVDAFNYMGRLGWTIVPLAMEPADLYPQYLFTKSVSAESEKMKGFVLPKTQ